MTIQFNVEPIAIKAAGIEATVDPSNFPDATLSHIFTYGLRRWFQDNLNSQAHAAKKDGEEFDAQAVYDARLAQAVDGDMATRQSRAPSNPLGKFALEVLREWLAANKGKQAKKIADALAECKTTQDRRDLAMQVLADNKDAMAIVESRYEAAQSAPAFSL